MLFVWHSFCNMLIHFVTFEKNKICGINLILSQLFIFSDFKMERNYLTKHAYPVLQEYCIANGLSFEVVDLRWGITDEVVNEHLVEKLCLLEIENCKRISPHLNFVVSFEYSLKC